MSQADDWDGSLPHEFIAALPQFWAGRNSGDVIMFGVPGRQHPIVDQFLGKAIAAQFSLEGPALEAAIQMVRRKCREDLAPPRNEPRGWLDSWRDVTWHDLSMIGRAKMGL